MSFLSLAFSDSAAPSTAVQRVRTAATTFSTEGEPFEDAAGRRVRFVAFKTLSSLQVRPVRDFVNGISIMKETEVGKLFLHLNPKFKTDRIIQFKRKVAMTFGERIRQLRKEKKLTQQELADVVGINFTYLSKIENDKIESSEFPSEETIKKLAKALAASADELLLKAKKVPDSIKKRVIQRPDAFRKFASLDDKTIDKLLDDLGGENA
jgi:transcriptional regulator with XRE-family HTH domain